MTPHVTHVDHARRSGLRNPQCYASAVRRITSRQNSDVTTYRAVARGDATRLLLDGPHLVADALAAGWHLEHLLMAADREDDQELAPLAAQAESAGTDVALGSASVMAAVSPVRSPSPIVAIALRPKISERMYRTPRPLVIIACDVQEPGNLGAMIRVAEGAGASGFVAAGQSADPFGWKALRGSMGSALRLPVSVQDDVPGAIDEARRHGCRILATVPRGGRPLFQADLTLGTALLIGSEGGGLGQRLEDAADERLTIPMTPPVESLNAAITVAVVVYEARRQRG